jgi:putative MATE family efflux protein
MNENSLVSGHLDKQLLKLAWPVIVYYLLHLGYGLVDMMWIGHLPDADIPLAAITVGAYVSWLIPPLVQLINVGLTTRVAKLTGSGDLKAARQVTSQALSFGFVFWGVLCATGLLTLEPFCRFMALPEAVSQEVISYLTVLFIGCGATYFMIIFESSQQGSGDTMTPLKIGLVAFGLNILLDPVLIFGLGPFPALGVKGAALASVSVKTTAVLCYLVLSKREKILIRSRDFALGFDLVEIVHFVRIGAPVAMVGILFVGVYFALVRVASPLGPGTVAAMGMVGRIEGITYVIVEGMGLATQTMVGQNIGAGQVDRAIRVVYRAVGWGSLAAVVLALFMWFTPELFVVPLSSNAAPETRAMAVQFLRIAAFAQVFMAWELILTGAFAGVGYTLPALTVALPLTLARIPLAYYLISPEWGLGGIGIYLAITITGIGVGLFIALWFHFGSWKSRFLNEVS